MSRPHDPWAPDSPSPGADPRGPREASARGTEPIPARPGYTVAAPPLRERSAHPPWEVQGAFWVWLASCTVGLAVTVYSVSRLEDLRLILSQEVQAEQPQIANAALDQVVDTTLYLGLGGAAALVAVQLVLAVLMRTRFNWARILLAVIGLLGLAWTVFSQVTVAESAQLVLWAQAALIVIATALMFFPGAGAWFRRRPG